MPYVEQSSYENTPLALNESLEMNVESSFCPMYVYDAIRAHNGNVGAKGRQEDAQEFLGFLLDGIHEELQTQTAQSEKWTSAKPIRRKTKMTASSSKHLENHSDSETFITRLFGFVMKSTVRTTGCEDSASIDTFTSLHLDMAVTPIFIQDITIHSLNDALQKLTTPEVLEGYTKSPGTTKQWSFEHLPVVLLIHLKRFIFQDGDTIKSHKHITYPAVLHIPTPNSGSY